MKEHLLKTLENSKTYTLSVAEAMPAKQYNTRPVDTVWTLGELLNHIAYGIEWWSANYILGNETEWAPPAAKPGKLEIVAQLIEQYNALQQIITETKVTDKIVNGFHATLDHITHHRGQAVLHLRTQGITPPEYIY